MGAGSSVAGVAALRRLDGPTDGVLGDHVCWTFADARDFSAVVLPYLDEGRLHGEQLLLIGSSPRPALLDAVASLPKQEEMLASGQLEVRAIPPAYPSGARPEPAAQVKLGARPLVVRCLGLFDVPVVPA